MLFFKNFFCLFFLKRMNEVVRNSEVSSSMSTMPTMPTMLPFGGKDIINHEIAKDLLGLTMLVYDYSNKFSLDDNETIESFVNQNDTTVDASDVQLEIDVTDERKEVLENLSKTSPHGRVVKFISDPTTDIQVGITISETNKRITVVFRGSESKSDWYYDLMILKTKILEDTYRNCSVHSGFYKQLHETDVYEQILEILKPLKEEYPEYAIYITGHSLGAALSTLFGFELSHEIESEITVVSFASPRVGNNVFRNVFDKKPNLSHFRISNDRDIVTAGPMINFQHVGINIALSEDKCEIFTEYNYNQWWKFSLFNCWKVSDHNVDLYYNRLCKNPW